MTDLIRIADVRRMFAEATSLIEREQASLSQLDSVGGDGDHGTTMRSAMKTLNETLSSTRSATLSSCFTEAGWKLLGVDGGASTAILGTFLAGMGEVKLGKECSCNDFAQSLLAGLSAVSRHTKAKPGDKTLMDALEPAIRAFAAATDEKATIADAMGCAALAAQQGADGTRDMIARFGRAKFLGERTRGSPDPGAVSIALIFRGFNTAMHELTP